MSFGEMLRRLRKARGLKHEDFASVCARNHVCRVEGGHFAPPKRSTLDGLLSVLEAKAPLSEQERQQFYDLAIEFRLRRKPEVWDWHLRRSGHSEGEAELLKAIRRISLSGKVDDPVALVREVTKRVNLAADVIEHPNGHDIISMLIG